MADAPPEDLRLLAARLTGAHGPGLFAVMAHYLAGLLQAREVLIGEAADEHHVRTLGVCAGGAIQPNYTFPLAGSPYESLVRGENTDDNASAEPANGDGSEPGYFGMALVDGASHVVGFVCAQASGPLHISEHQHCLIEVVAVLLTAELQLQRLEAERSRLEAQVLRLRADLDAVERDEVAAAATGLHRVPAMPEALDLDSEATGLHHVQREHILRVLNATRWVIEGNSGAALKLGMKPATLRHRMKKLGIARVRPQP